MERLVSKSKQRPYAYQPAIGQPSLPAQKEKTSAALSHETWRIFNDVLLALKTRQDNESRSIPMEAVLPGVIIGYDQSIISIFS